MKKLIVPTIAVGIALSGSALLIKGAYIVKQEARKPPVVWYVDSLDKLVGPQEAAKQRALITSSDSYKKQRAQYRASIERAAEKSLPYNLSGLALLVGSFVLARSYGRPDAKSDRAIRLIIDD
jgi:hypothetical protein